MSWIYATAPPNFSSFRIISAIYTLLLCTKMYGTIPSHLSDISICILDMIGITGLMVPVAVVGVVEVQAQGELEEVIIIIAGEGVASTMVTMIKETGKS